METRQITLPNSPDNFLLQEMCERLKNGVSVRIAFGGRSMLPMINGNGDKIHLAPIAEGEKLRPGEIYLFTHANHFIIHRLLRIKDGEYIFRGDNCSSCEHVQRNAVLARLTALERPDGTMLSTDSREWRRRSLFVSKRRSLFNMLGRMFGSKNRKWESIVYFVCLAILMWAPLNGVGIPLNNFVFGIRLDHLLHASVYLVCPFFLLDILHRRKKPILLVAMVIGICTEFVQYILPWRGFDINDLIANFLGSFLGWLALLPYFRRLKRD